MRDLRTLRRHPGRSLLETRDDVIPPDRLILFVFVQDHRKDRAHDGQRRSGRILSGFDIGHLPALRRYERLHQPHVVAVLQRRGGHIDRGDLTFKGVDHLLQPGETRRRRIAPVAVVSVVPQERCRLGRGGQEIGDALQLQSGDLCARRALGGCPKRGKGEEGRDQQAGKGSLFHDGFTRAAKGLFRLLALREYRRLLAGIGAVGYFKKRGSCNDSCHHPDRRRRGGFPDGRAAPRPAPGPTRRSRPSA